MSSVAALPKPIALVVFLENVGHITGVTLPHWLMAAIDWTTEEYAKLLLRLYGAHRRYDRVIILEDAAATGAQLLTTLQAIGRTHTIDLLLLAHGHEGCIVGYRGQERVGEETFAALRHLRMTAPEQLELRMVYGLNCYGLSLAWRWLELGVQAANGAVGVNWFPEPSLSVFLRNWLAGETYSVAVRRSNITANRWWRRILRPAAGVEHPWITSSRQIVVGRCDVTIDGASGRTSRVRRHESGVTGHE